LNINGVECESAEYYDVKVKADPYIYNSECGKIRNQIFLEFIKDIRFEFVIELAAGTGVFAEAFLTERPNLREYVHTDFSEIANELAAKNLSKFSQVKIMKLDVYNGDDLKILSRYESYPGQLVVCSSLEHFPAGIDLHIFSKIPSCVHILVCGSTFPITVSNSHCHVFKDEKYMLDRYTIENKLLTNVKIKTICDGAVVAMYGIKI